MQSVRFVFRTICPPLIKAVRTICLPYGLSKANQSVQFVSVRFVQSPYDLSSVRFVCRPRRTTPPYASDTQETGLLRSYHTLWDQHCRRGGKWGGGFVLLVLDDPPLWFVKSFPSGLSKGQMLFSFFFSFWTFIQQISMQYEITFAGEEENEVEDQQTADAILSINYRDKVGIKDG